jgi:hypothetical protein
MIQKIDLVVLGLCRIGKWNMEQTQVYSKLIEAVKESDLLSVKYLLNFYNLLADGLEIEDVKNEDDHFINLDLTFMDYSVYYFAAENGDLECLKLLHSNSNVLGALDDDVNVGIACVVYNHLDCLKYFHEHGGTVNTRVACAAAKSGHIDCLRYCYTHAENLDDLLVISAAVQNLQLSSFTYCFEVCKHPQMFWKSAYNCMLPLMDFDDAIWRRMFDYNLHDHVFLYHKVDAKKRQLKLYKDFVGYVCKQICSDVIQFSVNALF